MEKAAEFFREVRKYYLDDSIVYLDIGAYRGETYLELLRHGPHPSRAILCEPNPESFTRLEETIGESASPVELHQKAISSTNKHLKLRMQESMSQVTPMENIPLSDREVEVAAITLDELLSTSSLPHVNVLKVDVEGHELDVLEGAQQSLAQQMYDFVYIEVGFDPDNRQQTYFFDVNNKLVAHGYRVLSFFEQMHEWIDDRPFLRRANVGYISDQFSVQKPKLQTDRLASEYERRLTAERDVRELSQQVYALNLKASHYVGVTQRIAKDTTHDHHKVLEEARRDLADSGKKWKKELEKSVETWHREAIIGVSAWQKRTDRADAVARKEMVSALEYADNLEQIVKAILQSRSWRFTGPLRVAKRAIRRMLGRQTSGPTRLPRRPKVTQQTTVPSIELPLLKLPTPGLELPPLPSMVYAPPPPSDDSDLELPSGIDPRKATIGRATNWKARGYSRLAEVSLHMLVAGNGPGTERQKVLAARHLSQLYASQGRIELALQAIEACLIPDAGSSSAADLRSLRALYHLKLGQLAEARAVLAFIDPTAWGPTHHLIDGSLLLKVAPGAPAAAHSDALLRFSRALASGGLLPIGAASLSSPISLDNLDVAIPAHLRIESGPLVSVIVPTHNAEQTLETVLRCLVAQTYTSLEVLVVDDASTDSTASIVRQYAKLDSRIQHIRLRENAGTYGARNVGLAASTGDFVTVHDADDWSHPEKIARQLSLIQEGRPFALSSQVRMSSEMEIGWLLEPRPSLVQPNVSSALFRRKDAVALEGWDGRVRAGADMEFLRRLARIYGVEPEAARFPRALPDVPLSFTRHGSLTRSRDMGIRTSRIGARREYSEASRALHESWPRELGPIPSSKLTFSVPRALKHTSQNQYELDVLFAGDFNMSGGSKHSALAMIRAAKRAGMRIGVHHLRRPDLDSGRPLNVDFRSRMSDLNVEIVSAFESVATSGLVVTYPESLKAPRDGYPVIDADWSLLLVNQMAEATTNGGYSAYDPSQVKAQLAELVGAPGSTAWAPISNSVRDAMLMDSRYPAPWRDNWSPLVDLEYWGGVVERAPIIPHERRPVVGRHGRDHVLKWPESPEELREAYLVDSEIQFRILGGADIAVSRIGGLPANWNVAPFGSVDRRAFLAQLDFFIHYPHSELFEAFGRAIAEAMAAGVPVILPPNFERNFGHSALYATPDAVFETVMTTWTDEQLYAQRVDAGLEFVERHCDPRLFPQRFDAVSAAIGSPRTRWATEVA